MTGERRVQPRVVAGTLFIAAIVVVAAVAAWPIYRSGAFLALVVVAVTVGAGVAVLARRLRWSGWLVTAALAAATLVFGVPLAVPSRWGSFAEIARGIVDVAAGVVFGWKDLVTVDLPVGSYRNLLVPALVVFLIGTAVGLLGAWRERYAAICAVPVGLAMVSFGLFFGRPVVSDPVSVGSVRLYAPVETALGAASLVVCLLWLAWRAHDERVRALHRAAVSGGVRVSRSPSRADRRRTALGAGMLAFCVVVAAAVVPFAARGAEREVLRSSVGPEVAIARALSPLTTYRTHFADDRLDEVLFVVTPVAGPLPDRVRVATLDAYDGEVFRTSAAAATEPFVRVPSVRDAGEGEPIVVDVAVRSLEGIWMPTAGRLSEVQFRGPRATALADSFYYSADRAAGVQTAGGGLVDGDAYRLRAVADEVVELAALDPPRGVLGGVESPESLREWVATHSSGSGGAALDDLVRLLRERGYLSHALTAGEQPPAWAQSLPDYVFQPSTAGHSLARIEASFRRLLERETDPRAAASGNYVAAVGDDEQFAVAVALIARELGFPSRVVVGARLGGSAAPGLPACAEGVCRGRDLAVWTEVRSADGVWTPIDVTPQFERSPSLEVTEQRDPENVTEVRPDAVEEVVPPQPLQEDSAQDPGDRDAGVDLSWLWPVLRIMAIVLLALVVALGPSAVIVGAKMSRRRARRTHGSPSARIVGGWDEYVDAAVDAGRPASDALTRGELASTWGSPEGAVLAAAADRAVFSDGGATAADAAEFWSIVDRERRTFVSDQGLWRRIGATISLRSFVRHLAPVRGARTRSAERGKRRLPGPLRATA